jgi:glycine oxidase
LQAANFVIAGGAWSSLIRAKADSLAEATDDSPLTPLIQPVRGQMLCFKSEEVFARHVLCSPRGYIVPRRDWRLLAGATVEQVGFDRSVTDVGKRFVMRNAEEIAPSITRLSLVDEWAGLRPRGESAWPVLGRANNVDNLLYATGHFRNGILLAPITARIIADLITRRDGSPEFDHEWLKAFAPERLHTAVA